MANITKRIEALEARQRAVTCPPYLSVAALEDLPAALPLLPVGCFVKVYIGVSPDDWDNEP